MKLMTRDRSFYRRFFRLMGTLILQNIVVLSVNLADNVMIGAYSETALSGVAAANQVQFIFQQLVLAVGDALVAVSSQYWGQRRTAPIRQLAKGALLVGFGSGLVFFAVLSLFPHQVIGLFCSSEAIISAGADYLSLIRYTYLIYALTAVLLAMLRSVETVKVAFVSSVEALVINCVLNYALIGGHLGAPALGVRGAAIGTLCARGAELVTVLLYVIFRDRKLGFTLEDVRHTDLSYIADYAKTSFFFIVTGIMFGVSTALQTVILGHMTDSAIAANSVATTLFQLLKVGSVGAASAAAVIIGTTVGAGDDVRLHEYTRTLQTIFVMIGTVMSISLFFLREPILSLYSLSPETLSLARSFILVLCVTGFGTAYEFPTICGIIRGGGDTSFAFKNDLVSIWGIVLPLSFLGAFCFGWSPTVLVFCLNSDQLFKCVVAAVKCNSYSWARTLTRAAGAEGR